MRISLAVHAALDPECLIIMGPHIIKHAHVLGNRAEIPKRDDNLLAVVAGLLCEVCASDPRTLLIRFPGLLQTTHARVAGALDCQNSSHIKVACQPPP
jgi:hypothetical protein